MQLPRCQSCFDGYVLGAVCADEAKTLDTQGSLSPLHYTAVQQKPCIPSWHMFLLSYVFRSHGVQSQDRVLVLMPLLYPY